MRASNDKPPQSAPDPIIRPVHQPGTIAPPAIGDMIGVLRVDELIAEGGMGFVYRTWRTDLDVARAVKVLKPGLSEDSRARFMTEAKISAGLDHSNIVRIYNTGFWQRALPYIEMEYVDGNSLTELLRRHGRLPAPVCVAIISIIAAALDYASRQSFVVQGQTHEGLVHRDIKPGNILVSKQGHVKLSDFGLAQIGDVSLHTQQGAVMGTNVYMSPEQLEGARADQRCDIYAAGLVLYEALCGRRAFGQMSLPQLIAAKTKGDIEPVSRKVPDVPRAVARIVDRCVATDPRKRYRTYEQLQFACENALAEMIDRTAEAVVADFVSKPKSAEWITTGVSPANRRTRIRMVIWTGVVVTAAALGFWAIVSYLHRMDARSAEQGFVGPYRGFHTEQQRSEPAATGPNGPGVEQRHTTKEADQAQKAPSASPEQLRPLPRQLPRAKGAPAPSAMQDPHPTELDRALLLFSQGKHADAAGFFERLSSEAVLSSTRDSAFLMCIESHYRAGNMRQAYLIGSKRVVEDAHYYLFMGLLQDFLGHYASADTMFERAATTPTVMGAGVVREAMLQRARYWTRRYRRLPDQSIRARMEHAYRQFVDRECSHGEAACARARAVIRELEAGL